jgi:hypothetical protein
MKKLWEFRILLIDIMQLFNYYFIFNSLFQFQFESQFQYNKLNDDYKNVER